MMPLEDGIPAHSRGWNWMGFKVPSAPNDSAIVIFEKGAVDGTRGLRFSSRANTDSWRDQNTLGGKDEHHSLRV